MNAECIAYLHKAGISITDAQQLRRIAMTLHRWHELECGRGGQPDPGALGMTFPDQIRSWRQAHAMTQDELADLLDVDKQTISNWECGRTTPWPKQQVVILGRLLEGLRPARARVCERIL